MAIAEQETATNQGGPTAHCERCNLESRHLIQQTEPGGASYSVCWKCVSRGEKRINLKESWKRGGRTRSTRQ